MYKLFLLSLIALGAIFTISDIYAGYYLHLLVSMYVLVDSSIALVHNLIKDNKNE